MGKITVKGSGQLSHRVNQVVISLEYATTNLDYLSAYEENNQKIQGLQQALEKLDFAKENLVTLDFAVTKDFQGITKEGVWQQEFLGYRITQRLEIPIPFENERLRGIFQAVQQAQGNPELNLRFGVQETETIKNAALALAFQDAQGKAEILATAAKTSLGKLAEIKFEPLSLSEFSKSQFSSQNATVLAKSAVLEMQPAEVEFNVTVTCIWELL